jgi:hypothetical protein
LAAEVEGARQGYKYTSGHPISRMTFDDYMAVGREMAEWVYQTDRARIAFLYGWRQSGERIRTLFALSESDVRGGERKIQLVQNLVEQASKHLEAMLTWREGERETHDALLSAYNTLDRVKSDLDRALKKL